MTPSKVLSTVYYLKKLIKVSYSSVNEDKTAEGDDGPLATIKLQQTWQKPVSTISTQFQNCVDSAMEERIKNLESHVGVIKPGMYYLKSLLYFTVRISIESYLAYI